MRARIPKQGGAQDMNAMIRLAQKMQDKITDLQEDIEARDFTASVGGGAVEVVVTGKKNIKSLTIKPEGVDPEDIEMLQDLEISAVNEAIANVEKVTEEEIRSIIQEGAEDGEVQEVEQKIMGRVFSLGDRTVESIMTFRSELVWIDTAMTPEQLRDQVTREPHNRYPVGEGSLDKLAGVVYLKDLFRHIDDPGFDIRNHLSPAKFFHEGAEVYSALAQLRSEQLGYGIVCDEFVVTRGIVTLKDIFEALVGEIPDGYGEPDIVRREDGSVLIDGQCPFYDFLASLGIEEECSATAYNTISGLVLDQLDHIPQSGEHVEWNGYRIEVVDMDGARIDKLLVTPLEKTEK